MSQDPVTYGADDLPDEIWQDLEARFPRHEKVIRWIRSQFERCNSERVNAETGLHLFLNSALRRDVIDLIQHLKRAYDTAEWFKINAQLGLYPDTGTIKELIETALDARLPPEANFTKPIYFRSGPNNKGSERWMGPGTPEEGGGKWVKQVFRKIDREPES